MHHLELGYVVVEVPEPESLTPVFAGVVGLVRSDETSSVAWRIDDRAQRVVVTTGPANDATVIGFEAVDQPAFEATVSRLRSVGCVVEDGTDDEARRRRVDRLVRVRADWGVDVAVEVALGMERAATPFVSPLVTDGFHTDEVGLGHLVFTTQHIDAARRFLQDGLGFGLTERIEAELSPGVPLDLQFFHCNERHHTVALVGIPVATSPQLRHIMFETRNLNDVGRAFDRAWDSGLPIPKGLGRHAADGMFSFYLRTPAGFEVEVGHGGYVITSDGDPTAYDARDSWGHQELRPA